MVDVGDFQFVKQNRRPLGSQARHAEYGQHAFGNFGQKFFEHGQRAGLHQSGDFFGQILADALDIGKRAIRIGHDIGRRFGQIVNRARGVAIGPDPKRIRALELQQIGDMLENGGYFTLVMVTVLHVQLHHVFIV